MVFKLKSKIVFFKKVLRIALNGEKFDQKMFQTFVQTPHTHVRKYFTGVDGGQSVRVGFFHAPFTNYTVYEPGSKKFKPVLLF